MNENVYQTHCGADGANPAASDCGTPVGAEPGMVTLVLLGAILWRLVRAFVAGRHVDPSP